jgi:hypothetical protein
MPVAGNVQTAKAAATAVESKPIFIEASLAN